MDVDTKTALDDMNRRLVTLAELVAKGLDEANKINADSAARAEASEQRAAVREGAYDERNNRVEERQERQTRAWERIADALGEIAKARP